MIGSIYKIYSWECPNKIYIGSTVGNIVKIFRDYKKKYEYWKNKKGGKLIIFDLFDKYDINTFKVELIKTYDIFDGKCLTAYESLHISKSKRLNECVNKNQPFVIPKLIRIDYYNKNKDKIKEYYKNNKEKIIERVNKNYQKNKEKRAGMMSKYYMKNSEKFKEAGRRNYLKNRHVLLEKVDCACGSRVTKANYKLHCKSDKHKNYTESQENNQTQNQVEMITN